MTMGIIVLLAAGLLLVQPPKAQAQQSTDRQLVLSAIASFVDSIATVDPRFTWPSLRKIKISSELCSNGGLPNDCALGGWQGRAAEAEWAPDVETALRERVPRQGIDWRVGQSTRYTGSFSVSDVRCAAKELITFVTPVDTDREEIRVPIRLSVQPGDRQCTLLPNWSDGVLVFVKSANALRLKSFSGFRHSGS